MQVPTSNAESRPVFSHQERVFTVGEIINAAFFRGEGQSLWAEATWAAESVAAADEQELEVDGEQLQALSEDFRYRRELITSEETEQWLASRDLTMDDWENHLVRKYWRQRAGDAGRPDSLALLVPDEEGRELLRHELILSGTFQPLALRLSQRVTALAATPPGTSMGGEPMERERERFLHRAGLTVDTLADWLNRLEVDAIWWESMLRMETAYRLRCEALLTPAARIQMLSRLRLQMIRMVVETIELESSGAAREATLCLREDHIPMAELAEQARYPYRRSEWLMTELPAELQQSFLGAAVGAVVGPFDRHGGFELHQLVSKSEPSLDDPRVQERVDRQILESCFADLDSKMVRWLLREESMG